MDNEELSPWKKYKKSIGETRPWDIVNPTIEHSSTEEADARYNICNSCPEFIGITKQCKKCGCCLS